MGRKKHPTWVWLMVLSANDGRCVYCGGAAETMDHVIPWSRGGLDSYYNMVPACDRCNDTKNDKTPIEWAVQREFRERWPLRTRRRNSQTLRGAFEEAQQVCSDLLDHLDLVQAEITDGRRSDWFFERYWGHRASDSVWISVMRGWAADSIAEAKANGWALPPKPKPKRYRVTRKYLGQVMEEIPDDE
ncbi:HNH endonuclease [Streptomyces sp. NPDC058239]|uniref:HNH endonuclease n=1 Tax=Streptomyces sp. NPDC058239 TaxID=3346395 RepID=UPI0036E80968